MINEEALNQFNSTNPLMHGSTNITNRDEYFELIKQALEKQIYKKPVKRYTEDLSCTNKFDSCPSCGSFEIEGCKYCPDCGQALDWSDDE